MKLNVVRMDAKGRISIPFHLRRLFDISAEDELTITIVGHTLTLEPVRDEEHEGERGLKSSGFRRAA